MKDDRTPRAMCSRCERPAKVCYCDALITLETSSRIVILQHPREQGMPIGTAHMAHLCLPASSIHVGTAWDGSDVLRDACADPRLPAVLLFPGPGARDVLRDPPPAPVTLIVVDGTWAQAGSVVRDNPGLAALPRIAFDPPEPTNYRIRREPRADYVSTLESIMHVLGAIEGDADRFRALMRPMNAMVDAQLREKARASRPRTARPRPRLAPFDRLPRAVRERHDDLVLVFGEASAWPYGTPGHALRHELVHWVAHRPRTGETFSFVVAPRNPLSPDAPRHVGIPLEDLAAGGSPAELFAAFAAFTRPTDVIASWGARGVQMYRRAGGELPDAFLDMRRAARVLTNRMNGTLEDYATATVTRPVQGLPPGRAGRRLGMLIGILEAWRALPRTQPAPGAARGSSSPDTAAGPEPLRAVEAAS